MSQYGIQMGDPEPDVRGIRREKQREKKRRKMDQGKRLKLLLQLILRKSEAAKKRASA